MMGSNTVESVLIVSEETTVIAVDPGLITGVCKVAFTPDAGCQKLWSKELEFADLLPWALVELSSVDVTVVERFTINQRTIKNTQAPWSLMGIGVITAVEALVNREIVLQNPGDAMNLVDNDMLRRLDLWHRGGAGHANDALRHTVLYAVKHLRWRDPRMAAQ